MGQKAIKERQAAAKAKKREAQKPNASGSSSVTAAEKPPAPVPAVTDAMPEAETVPAKKARTATSAHSTRSRSASASIPLDPKSVGNRAGQMQVKHSDADDTSDKPHPVRKASTAVRTLLHQIALSEIMEGSGDEVYEELDDEDEDTEDGDGGYEVVDVARAASNKLTSKQTISNTGKRSAMHVKLQESEPMSEDEDNGE